MTTNNAEIFTVQMPEHVKAGSLIAVKAPDGKLFQLSAPDLQPGADFQVRLPHGGNKSGGPDQDLKQKIDGIKEVREQPASMTSIYEQGVLIKDGNVEGSQRPKLQQEDITSMNTLLAWAIENSDPEALAENAALAQQGDGLSAKVMSEENKKWLQALMPEADAVKMKACLDAAVAEGAAEDDVVEQLEELEFYVETIDNANDLPKVGGLDVCLDLLTSPSPPVRAQAAAVLATCLQNNPSFQEIALEADLLSCLLTQIENEQNQGALGKEVYALSALVRGYAKSQKAFEQRAGVPLLLVTLGRCDMKTKRRILFLLGVLLFDTPSIVEQLYTNTNGVQQLVDCVGLEDIDCQEKALEVLLLVSTHGGAAAIDSLRSVGCADAVAAVLANSSASTETQNVATKIKQNIA